ncbi:thioredoxin family protein [Desulfovibrio sp. A2]|nr:thioredoxin family protein [Desulfovibrio sp. A2]
MRISDVTRHVLPVALLCLLALGAVAFPAYAGNAAHPAKGTVTVIDLGAKSCVPCRMMAPILSELKVEYAGKANVVFIDAWENPDQSKAYGIRVIPTQIFYDKSGAEVYRHEGFMDKDSIRRMLDVLLKG